MDYSYQNKKWKTSRNDATNVCKRLQIRLEYQRTIRNLQSNLFRYLYERRCIDSIEDELPVSWKRTENLYRNNFTSNVYSRWYDELSVKWWRVINFWFLLVLLKTSVLVFPISIVCNSTSGRRATVVQQTRATWTMPRFNVASPRIGYAKRISWRGNERMNVAIIDTHRFRVPFSSYIPNMTWKGPFSFALFHFYVDLCRTLDGTVVLPVVFWQLLLWHLWHIH